MLRDPRRVARGDRVRRYAAGDERIRSDNGISSDYKLTSVAHDSGSEPDPSSFFDAERSTLRHALQSNRLGRVRKCVVVIGEEHRRTEDRIASDMNTIFGRDHAASPDFTTVFQDD